MAWRPLRREVALLAAVTLSYAFGYTLFVAKLCYRILVRSFMFVFAGIGAVAVGHAAARWRNSRSL